jgi:hypothetical protein
VSLRDDPTALVGFPVLEDLGPEPDEHADDLDDRYDVHPSTMAWSLHMSLALAVGLLVSWSSLMGALGGSVPLRDALLQLAATSTVALLGITFVAALYRFLDERQDDSVEGTTTVAVATAGAGESDV